MDDLQRQLNCLEILLRQVLHRLHNVERNTSIMASNDSTLTQAVVDLTSAFKDQTAALDAELANLKAAQGAGDDEAIDDAVTKIEAVVTSMKANTAAAVAAVTPAPAETPAPAATDTTAPAADASAPTAS